jgi:hypothetical protein
METIENFTLKKICLNNEVFTSIKLLELGFRELHDLKEGNDFYYLPFQLLSSGFERLMKCIICLNSLDKNGRFPNQKNFKTHDLINLMDIILHNCFSKNCTATKMDYDFLKNDKLFKRLLELLSEFGKYARYYNLDIVTNAASEPMDVDSEWKATEMEILQSDKKMWKKFVKLSKNPQPSSGEKARQIYLEINRRTIVTLERFARALSRQFTLGKLGELANQLSGAVHPFLFLTDSDLGTQKYNQ